MARNPKSTRRISTLDFIKKRKLPIFLVSLTVVGLIGVIGYTAFGGYVDEAVSSTLNSDLADIDSNSVDATDSDLDDDLIVDDESLAAYDIATVEEEVEVR